MTSKTIDVNSIDARFRQHVAIYVVIDFDDTSVEDLLEIQGRVTEEMFVKGFACIFFVFGAMNFLLSILFRA